MYIEKYWGNYIGDTDDSLNLTAVLADLNREEIPLREIFRAIGLDRQSWDFHQTMEHLYYMDADGLETDFQYAIDVILDLAALLLECRIEGCVDLKELNPLDAPSRSIRITATEEERSALNRALEEFAEDPFRFDLREMMEDEDMEEMAGLVKELLGELRDGPETNQDPE